MHRDVFKYLSSVPDKRTELALRGAFRALEKSSNPVAKTTSTTLSASDLLAGIITVNQGAGGTSTLTLPTASNLNSALPDAEIGEFFDFYVINTSTVAAEDASIATNTGWTLVGNMEVHSNDAPATRSAAHFRARKTGSSSWTLYRVS